MQNKYVVETRKCTESKFIKKLLPSLLSFPKQTNEQVRGKYF